MLFRKKNKTVAIPQGFTAEDIRVESSTCTGERTIGFFSTAENRLMYAELVTRDEDIEKFYEKYGLAKA
jgi:hypothetical protein